MACESPFELEWDYLLQYLPELDESARRWGALRRRRGIDRAETLLRLALVFGYCDRSYRETAAWASGVGVARVSDVALLKRFRSCGPWLAHLVAQKIASRAHLSSLSLKELRPRLIDATAISAPGNSGGVDWRLHLGLDLATMTFDAVELTDGKGGERFTRFTFKPNDLVIADRGYSSRTGLFEVEVNDAFFLVRLGWSNTPLRSVEGGAFDLFSFLRSLPEAEPLEQEVILELSGKSMSCRLIALRKTEASAEHSRDKALRERRKKGVVDPRTLEAAGYTILLTNVSEDRLSRDQALELYRFRWQVELAFKRLKSLIQLDHLRAKDPDVAQTFLFAKILGALLIEDLTEIYVSFSPWGYPVAMETPQAAG